MTAPPPQGLPTFKVLAPLPRRVPYVERFRALDTTLIREVELRIPAGPEDAGRAEFEAELTELAALDHPAFLPVLGSGVAAGRPYYTVPYREAPSLEAALADPAFTLAERCQVVRALAAAIATVHLHGLTLRGLELALVDLDREQGLVAYVHHRGGLQARLLPEGTRRPADLAAEASGSPRSDVFLWGLAGYRILAGGALPWDGVRPGLIPIRERVRELGPALAHALESCLAEDPGARPESAVALHALLRQPARDVLPATEIPLEASGSIPVARVRSALGELAAEGRIPKPRPVRRAREAGASGGPVAPPARAEPISGAIVMGATGVLATCLLWIWLVQARPGGAAPAGGPPRRPVLAGPAAGPGGGMHPDPYLRLLVEAPEVRARDFTRYHRILAALARGGRLPAATALDPTELEALGTRFGSEPDRAAAELERLLADVRRAVVEAATAPPADRPGR